MHGKKSRKCICLDDRHGEDSDITKLTIRLLFCSQCCINPLFGSVAFSILLWLTILLVNGRPPGKYKGLKSVLILKLSLSTVYTGCPKKPQKYEITYC